MHSLQLHPLQSAVDSQGASELWQNGRGVIVLRGLFDTYRPGTFIFYCVLLTDC